MDRVSCECGRRKADPKDIGCSRCMLLDYGTTSGRLHSQDQNFNIIEAIRDLDTGEGVDVYALAEATGRMERAVIHSLRRLQGRGRVRRREAYNERGNVVAYYSLMMPKELEGPGYRVGIRGPAMTAASTSRDAGTGHTGGCYQKWRRT